MSTHSHQFLILENTQGHLTTVQLRHFVGQFLEAV